MPSENPAIQNGNSAQPNSSLSINNNTGTTSAMRIAEIAFGIQFSDISKNESRAVEKIQRTYRIVDAEVAHIDSFFLE